jgi:hypothetical protein
VFRHRTISELTKSLDAGAANGSSMISGSTISRVDRTAFKRK